MEIIIYQKDVSKGCSVAKTTCGLRILNLLWYLRVV